MFKKDNTPFGFALGILAPLVVFIVLYLIFFLIVRLGNIEPFMRQDNLAILSLAMNFILIRYYFNRLKFQETGKGILLITIGLIMIFFLFIREWDGIILPGLKAM